jgi:hypothetical protein
MNEWTSRVVTDTIGDAGVIVLDDERAAYDDLRDWLMDYYDMDAEEAGRWAEELTASVLSAEAREFARGLFGIEVEFDGEWSAERSARAVYDYLASRDEAATMSRTSVSLGAMSLALGDDRGESGEEALAGSRWRCGRDGEGRIMDESDVREAAEYLRAVAGEN